MFVKVCGVRTEPDVAAAVSAGADAIGFVLTESVRQVDAETARRLAAGVPSHVLSVGVVRGIPAVTAGKLALAAGLGAVQLHGDYPREAFQELAGLGPRLVRATAFAPGMALRAGAFGEDILLLDSPVAGSGQRWDLSVLGHERPRGHWVLAGGLSPANVAAAIGAARPWGVDVSSGVEASPGVKDGGLIHDFVAAARAAAGERGLA